MNRSSNSTLSGLAATVAAVSFCVTAHAANPCLPVFDALTKVVTTASHSFTTSTSPSVNGGRATESETIFVNGQKYIRARGKWMRIPVTSQDSVEQEKKKEEHGESTCQFLRNESVNGEDAMLYSLHREYDEVTEDGEMWVSKGSGLPLRAEEDVDNRANKVREHRSTRFEYGDIRPPT